MVRVEFFGAWDSENRECVRRIVAAGIEKNLKIAVLPTYFEEFSEPAGQAARKNAVWENPPREKSARDDADLHQSRREEKRVSVIIAVFPAGNGRMRRQAAREITENIARQAKIPEENVFVTLEAPPQERRSYAEGC